MNRTKAIETMLRHFPDLIELIWVVRGDRVNVDILKNSYLSSGQYLLVSSALSIWDGDLAKIDLEKVIATLDDSNFRAWIEAMLIARANENEP